MNFAIEKTKNKISINNKFKNIVKKKITLIHRVNPSIKNKKIN